MKWTSIFLSQFGFAGVAALSPWILFGFCMSRYIDIDLSSLHLRRSRARLGVVHLGNGSLQNSADYLPVSHRNFLEHDPDMFGLFALVAGDRPGRYHRFIEKQLEIYTVVPACQSSPLSFKSDRAGDEHGAPGRFEQGRADVLDGKFEGARRRR